MGADITQSEQEIQPAATEHRADDGNLLHDDAASDPHDLHPHNLHHDQGLLLIGLFKLGKAVLFFFVGMGALHMMEKNLGDEVIRLVVALRRDPEGRLVQLALEKADLISAHQLREIGLFSFGYSCLALTEGIGLMLEKVWAEYLTVFLTVSFLPWELFELARRPSWFRFGVLLTNLAVLGYLMWLLQRKKHAAAA